ncbi:hypothetical protein HY214_04310 [Candidatus Roizmanbacteria bacterium]|nr:hypothetical protein [Candidatus Roizmanbacteria bacterium]
MVKKLIVFFIKWRLILFLIVFLAAKLIPASTLLRTFNAESRFIERFPYLLWVWGNYDGAFYLGIAERGYFTYEHAFFPLYPLCIHILSTLLSIPLLLSAQLISNLSLLIALFFLYKTLRVDNKESLFELMLFIIFIFPTSFYYAAVYNDSLFFLLATACIYFGRRNKWLTSSVLAALATLARLNGLALFFFLLLEYAYKGQTDLRTWDRQKLKAAYQSLFKKLFSGKLALMTFFFIPAAFIGYLVYTHIAFGSWSMVFTSMKVWNQDRVIFPPQVVWRYLKILFLFPSFHLNYFIAAFEFSNVLYYLFFLFYSFKKIRLSYWIFFALSILIPSLTGTFQGMPRYGLHLYPLFLSVTLFLRSRSKLFLAIYFLISGLFLLMALSLFSRGYFVA